MDMIKSIQELKNVDISIKDNKQYSDVCTLLKDIKANLKSLEDSKKEEEKEYKEKIKEIVDKYKANIDEHKKAESFLKEVISKHIDKLDKQEQVNDNLPVLVEETPEIEGISFRKPYDFKIEDKKAILQAVLDGHLTDDFVDINEKIIKDRVDKMGEFVNIPGIKVYKKTTVVVKV